VIFWNVAGGSDGWFSHQQDNLSRLIGGVKAAVAEKTGSAPYLVLDESWPRLDSSIAPGDADGVNDWFVPPDACSVRDWHGTKVGVSVPGFEDIPGPNSLNRLVPRNGGETLRACMSRFTSEGVFLTILEGLTNVEENAGYYRSAHPDWSHPTQYLDIVRTSMPPR
jgi:hypothetical protein